MNTISLKSKEGTVIIFPSYLKEISKFVRLAIDEYPGNIIPVPFSCKTLDHLKSLVLKLPATARNSKAKPAPMTNIYQVTKNTNLDEITFLVNRFVYDNVFHLLYTILDLSQEEVFDLLLLSNYLDIPSIRNAISRFVAGAIQKDLDELPPLNRQRNLNLVELLTAAVKKVTKDKLPGELVVRISKYVYLQILNVYEEKTIADEFGLSGTPKISQKINLYKKELTGISGLELLKSRVPISLDLRLNYILGNNLDPDFPDSPFNGLINLRYLNLFQNELTSLPKNVFYGLVNLKSLNLSSLPHDSDVPTSLRNFQQHYISSNQLVMLQAGVFNGLPSLQNLDLSDNQITTLQAGLFNGLPSLQNLDLSNNRITTLQADVFNGIPSLQILDLSDNQFTTLQAGVFNRLTNLQNLNLSNNQLTTIQVGSLNGLTHLQTLNLSYNQITTIQAGVFNGLTNLQSLELGENQLAALPDGLFNPLVSLNWLVLRNNNFSLEYLQTYAFPQNINLFI